MTAPFKAVKAIRMWHSRIGDDGACALAELLRLGGADVAVSYLELWDNKIGPRGCRALGVSLMVGGNKSLQTLRLDYNAELGSEGVSNLCRGLRSNGTLRQLHLAFCEVGPEAGLSLADALASPALGLLLLNLEGNKLGDAGLQHLCRGLGRNTALAELNLAGNAIGTDPEALGGVAALAEVLTAHPALKVLNLNFNRLCLQAAEALLPGQYDPNDPAKPNPRLSKVVVDAALQGIPPEIYERLNVSGGGGKKGKKGKKKK
jgi:hypothetical protein